MIMQRPLEHTKQDSVILPLSYLPSIDHYCFLARFSNLLFEVHETFPKQTCRNRTNILSANGVLRLSVPVIKPNGNRTRTNEVIIDNKEAWNRIHWRAIVSAYNKSPFFLFYKDDFEAVYDRPEGLLIDFNQKLIGIINKSLKIKTDLRLTDNYLSKYNENYYDFRNCPKQQFKTIFNQVPYTQVFADRFPFMPNLSIIDLLFNEGPYASKYLMNTD